MNYPKLQKLLERELKEYRRQKFPERARGPGRRPTTKLTAIAKEWEVGVATLTNWLNGTSYPRPKQMDKLLDHLRPQGGSERHALKLELEDAKRSGSNELEPLKIALLRYPPFSGSETREVG